MIPALLGAAALWGINSVDNAKNKFRNANEINSQAAKIANAAKLEVDKINDKMNESLDTLGKTELRIMSGNVERFVNMMSKIYENFEFRRNQSGLEKLERMGFRKAVIDELHQITNKAIALGATSGLNALEGCSYSAVGLLGSAVLGVVAAPAMLIYGLMKSDEAEAALYEARSRLDEARLYEQRCKNLCVLFEAISTRSRMLNGLVVDLDSYLSRAVKDVEDIVSRRGFDFDSYSEYEELAVYYAYQITNTVKILIETPIVQKDWSINPQFEDSLEIGQKNIGMLREFN